jgi:hypothetical protein
MEATSDMDGLDRFEQIAHDAQYALVLLANEWTGDWELIEPEPVAPATAQTFAERGLVFGGILGIVSGRPRVALDVELDDEVSTAITQAFVAWVRKHARWMVRPDMHQN